MIVLDPGHFYVLERLDGTPDQNPVKLLFVKRFGDKYPKNELPIYSGTTSQEVLRALHDRACYLHNQIPCWETRISIPLLGAVIWLYERRAARRHGRQAPSYHQAIFGMTCGICGHVGCAGLCRKGH